MLLASQMPMLTDPAQQSANRTGSRSELSSNWRTRIDAPPTAGNNAATRTQAPLEKSDYLQRLDFRSRGRDEEENEPRRPLNGGQLRGEDDPTTLQAIAEGRRLYVGNMPYIAKTNDVERLFAENDCQVYVFYLGHCECPYRRPCAYVQ